MLVTPGSTAEDRFLDLLPAVERIIAFVARRQNVSAADTEDFGAYVKLKLIEDDYGILRKHEGRSSMQTYLRTVILAAADGRHLPHNPFLKSWNEALFNRALALEVLQPAQAAEAWRAVAEREPDSPWAREALTRASAR